MGATQWLNGKQRKERMLGACVMTGIHIHYQIFISGDGDG